MGVGTEVERGVGWLGEGRGAGDEGGGEDEGGYEGGWRGTGITRGRRAGVHRMCTPNKVTESYEDAITKGSGAEPAMHAGFMSGQ